MLTCQARCACLCNRGSAIVGKTSSLPIGFKVLFGKREFISGIGRQSAKTKSCDWRGHGEAKSVVLLDACDEPVGLPSKCVSTPLGPWCYQHQLVTTGEASENK